MTPAPKRCPACGCSLRNYEPEKPDEFEGWEFECDAIILRAENGKLFVENDCELVTTKAVDALNKAATPVPFPRPQSPQDTKHD